jgi:hypothetical protein
MPKALCLISLGASIAIVALFLTDAAMGMAGLQETAPLRAANLMMDIAFVVIGLAMASLSWFTYKEQR